jgi:NAD+ kinase
LICSGVLKKKREEKKESGDLMTLRPYAHPLHLLVVVKDSTDPDRAYTDRVRQYFEDRSVQVTVKVVDFKDFGPALRLEAHQSPLSPDMILVIGGDGTFLRTARVFAQDEVPMVGINRGHLGFLTSISPDTLEPYLDDLFEGRFFLEHREMIACHGLPPEAATSGGALIPTAASTTERLSHHYAALNDVVLKGENPSQLIRLNLCFAGEPIARIDADGLIVSTATGSTAYNLAAGGPVISPALQAFCITPICAHTLTARPIVVPSNTPIEVAISQHNTQPVQVSVDGEAVLTLQSGERMEVKVAPQTLRLIRFQQDTEGSFYRLLTQKFRWAENPRVF